MAGYHQVHGLGRDRGNARGHRGDRAAEHHHRRGVLRGPHALGGGQPERAAGVAGRGPPGRPDPLRDRRRAGRAGTPGDGTGGRVLRAPAQAGAAAAGSPPRLVPAPGVPDRRGAEGEGAALT